MSEVIAIRVSKELKKELKDLGPNYAEEIRELLKRMTKGEKIRKVMKEVEEFRARIARKTGVTASSAEIIRGDREHGH